MASSDMKMVNGRISAQAAAQASRVLGQHGLTISAFIRNSLENIARTGAVPKCGLPHQADAPDIASLRELVAELESLPMPGRSELAAGAEPPAARGGASGVASGGESEAAPGAAPGVIPDPAPGTTYGVSRSGGRDAAIAAEDGMFERLRLERYGY